MTAGLALGTAGQAGAEPDAAAHLQRANELVSQDQLAAACDCLRMTKPNHSDTSAMAQSATTIGVRSG